MPDWVDLPLLSGSVQQRADSAGNILGSSALEDSATNIDPRISDFILYGVFNGGFARGPEFPDDNIGDENPLPDWTGPIQVSGGAITCRWVEDSASPLGYNLRFTIAPGAASDEAYVEQIVPIGGSRARAMGNYIHSVVVGGSANTADITVKVQAQPLDHQLAPLGGGTIGTDTVTAGATTVVVPVGTGIALAAYLRIRIGIVRSAAAADTGTVEFTEVRQDQSAVYVAVADATTASTSPGIISQTAGVLKAASNGATLSLESNSPKNITALVGTYAPPTSTPGTFIVRNGDIQLDEQSAPSTPASGSYSVYAKTDGILYGKNDAGTEWQLGHYGNLAFPATQVASANANTLDDYEEGTWTPVLTFATPGDLNRVTSVAAGRYVKTGRVVWAAWYIITTTWTHTTAAGNLQITGLPFTSQNENPLGSGAVVHAGWTKAGYGSTVGMVTNNSTLLTEMVGDSGGGPGATLVAADCPSGTQQRTQGHVIYFAAA